MSVALIDQPGAGRRWVREGAKVMHLTIERIKEGAIIVKGGQGVSELAVPKVREVNLLDDGSPSASAGVPASVPASIASSLTLEAPTDTRGADVGGRITQPVPPTVTEEERARAEKLFAELEAMATQRDPAGSQGKVSAGQGARGAPRSAPEATRIGDEEAEKLDDLGQELKKVRQPDRGRNLKDPRARIDQRLEERRKRIEALAQKRIRGKQAPEDQRRPRE
jgi:hypothetical protein